ncbi:hypothetical protein A3860_16855 [Niastella vici]|uniref:DUF3887 domain-containing protein n=1 Tax=Niastella vici TaxID=1703345 RepID=A0A1V9G426_9BACT|nr:hypothetical protein [Niastella vici]OQP65337.1 hypothetical protein A3860_16855 [Niastella vici]
MRKTLFALTVFVVSNVTIYAQSVPVDSHKRIVEQAQGLTTEKFLRFLEQGKIDEALPLIDTSYLESKTHYEDTLTNYHQELSKYLSTSKLSIVVVTPDKKYNTYRCIYHNKKGYNFTIDLYYKKGKSGSKITRIAKKPEKSKTGSAKTGSAKTKTALTSAKRKTARKTIAKS